MDCSKVRRDVARLIYFCLGKHGFFFWHSTVKKTRLTMPGAWLFYLYIKLCACMDAMCKEGLTKKKRLRAGSNVLGNLNVNFVPKNSHENITPAFH